MPNDKGSTRAESPEHRAWRHLRERCLCSSHPNYHNYGGRGLTGISRKLIGQRINNGWLVGQAVTMPSHRKSKGTQCIPPSAH